jgi:hypothetical protein
LGYREPNSEVYHTAVTADSALARSLAHHHQPEADHRSDGHQYDCHVAAK